MVFYPVLSRIYNPSDFGLLATIISLSVVIGVFATGKYETVIIIATTNKNAINLISLSILFSSISLIIFSLLIFIFSKEISNVFNEPRLEQWLYLSPLIALFISIYQCYNEWSVRNKYYLNLSKNKISNTFVITFSKLFMGWLKKNSIGLIVGEVIGRFISAIYSVFLFLKKDRAMLKQLSFLRMKVLAKKYSQCPKFIIPAQLLNTIGGELPVFIFAYYFSTTEIGYYGMALLILSVPSSIISLAIRDVFRKKANDEYVQNGNCRSTYVKVLGILFLISLFGYSLFYILAPSIFVFVLGAGWSTAGIYARLLIPMVAISFVTEVGSSMFIIAEKMKALLIWQILYFSVTVISLLCGVLVFKNIRATLVCFSIGRSIVYLVSFLMSYYFAKGTRYCA